MPLDPPAPARLTAIIFDAGNTLIRQDYAAMAACLLERGHAVTPAGVEEAEQRARIGLDADLAPGASTESRDTTRRYMGHVLAHLGITVPDEVDALARWRRSYNPPAGVWNQADPRAKAALARARRHGVRAGVISNSNGSIRATLEATGLLRYLDFVIDSAVVGLEKPDPRIFTLGLREAGAGPEEAAYVGDLYSVDVLGARAAGVDAILLDPGGYWGPRDCRTARDVDEAVRVLLGD